MLAAEAGADYVMFGEPDENGHRPSFDAVIERVEWWAEVFEIPCVGFAAHPDEIAGAGQPPAPTSSRSAHSCSTIRAASPPR